MEQISRGVKFNTMYPLMEGLFITGISNYFLLYLEELTKYGIMVKAVNIFIKRFLRDDIRCEMLHEMA